ncbi:MAG TPA: molecular chaperone HtpG, partial [Caldilineaceae bacterium]|nr:molecular chaperone HtpG [Caldilineaceae bacterium]
ALVGRVKQRLGERVADVRESKQLVDNPCRLVSPENEFDRDMQRLRRLMEQDFQTPVKILELNRRHGLVRNLAALMQNDSESRLIDATIEQLFANALLVEGIHPNPAEMVERIQMLMEAAVSGV